MRKPKQIFRKLTETNTHL